MYCKSISFLFVVSNKKIAKIIINTVRARAFSILPHFLPLLRRGCCRCWSVSGWMMGLFPLSFTPRRNTMLDAERKEGGLKEPHRETDLLLCPTIGITAQRLLGSSIVDAQPANRLVRLDGACSSSSHCQPPSPPASEEDFFLSFFVLLPASEL